MSTRNSRWTSTLLPVTVRRWEFFAEYILVEKKNLFWSQVIETPVCFRILFKSSFDEEFWTVRVSNCFRGPQKVNARAKLIEVCWKWYHELACAPVEVQLFAHYGLGLVAKEDIQLKPDSTFPGLKGQLIRLSSSTFQKLHKRGYRSLYSGSKGQGVLIGPISLLNHYCGERQLFFNQSLVVKLKSSEPKRRTLIAGCQIFINYGYCFGDICLRCPNPDSK